MSIRPWRDVHRRKSRKIRVGDVEVGGDAPISVQTMTNTLTTDAKATIEQVLACAEAGADIVRVSCPDQDSTRAFREIAKESPVPLHQGPLRCALPCPPLRAPSPAQGLATHHDERLALPRGVVAATPHHPW